MKQSESISTLAPALVAAQAEIAGVVKSASNPFFKSNYADLNSVILEIKPIFVKNGFAIIQFPVSDENGVGVLTRVQHTSGEFIEERFTLPLSKPDPQQAGSAITYAKRYALKALGLMPDLDDDAEGAMYRQPAQVAAGQKETYVALMAASDGWGLKKFANDVGSEVMDALFNDAPKGQKSKQKALCRELVVEANKQLKLTLAAIEEAIESKSGSALDEIFGELTTIESNFVHAGLTEVQEMQISELLGASNE